MKAGRPAIRVTSHQTRNVAASESGTVIYSECLEILEDLRTDFKIHLFMTPEVWDKKRLAEKILRGKWADAWPFPKNKPGRVGLPKEIPENKNVFGAFPAGQIHTGLAITFSHPDYYRRPWNFARSCACALVGCTTGRDSHPAPKVDF